MKKILSAVFLSVTLCAVSNEIDTWSSPPDTLSSSGVDASYPHVAMDTNGNAFAVWVENNTVVSKTLPFGGSWSSLNTLSGTGGDTPQIVSDPSGNVTAIWVESGAIKTAYMPSGSSWGSATTLASSSSSAPQIGVNSNGDLVAVWVTSGNIESSTKPSGGSWLGSPNVLTSSGTADDPQIAVSDSGDVVAVWHAPDSVSGIDTIYAATKTISGGTWSSTMTVSDPSVSSVHPKVAIDTNGNSIATWFRYDLSGSAYSNVILQSSDLAQGSLSWSTPANVSTPGIQDPTNLVNKIQINPAGNAIAIWTITEDGNYYILNSAVKGLNQPWSGRAQIGADLYDYDIDVAVNAVGDAIAAYMIQDPSSSDIVINYVESHVAGFAGGSWTSPVTLSSATANSNPEIATVVNADTYAYAIAAWLGYDGSNKVVQSSSGTGTLVTPPTDAAVVQNSNSFGAFTEYYNEVSWTASTDPNLFGYVIYRDGIFIQMLDSSATSYVDHNREQGGSVTYGITAFDDANNESVRVTVSYP